MFDAILVMAGASSRAKTKGNKTLELLNGKPIFMYSYEVFKKYNANIILVVRESDIETVKKYVDKDTIITIGGDTRCRSVYNGLLKCKSDFVFIHDAARPFIKCEYIDDILSLKNKYRAFFVGVKVKDTIRLDGKTLDRDNLVAAQTPQAFYKDDIKKALEKAIDKSDYVFDDIEAIEKYSDIKYQVINGSDSNFKITTPFDLEVAKMILGSENK